MIVACGRVRRRSRRPVRPVDAGWPVAGSRTVWLVACRMAGRRIACRMAHPVGMVVPCRMARCRIACRMARRRIACRHVAVCVGNLEVPAMFTVGHPDVSSSAMSRPNMAL